MIRMLIIIFLLTAAQPAAACTLAAGDIITIGCTIECSQSVRGAFEATATKLGLKVDFVTLMTTPGAKYDAIFSPGGADIGPEYYTRDLPTEMKQKIEEENQNGANSTLNARAGSH